MSEITEDQLDSCRCSFEEEYLQEYLERVSNILEISSPKYCIKLGTKIGDNYLGVIYRILIEGERNNEPIKIQTILKVPPNDEVKRQAFRVQSCFLKEYQIYSEILPIFKEFLQAKNKRLESVAQCYFASDVDHKEVICLEDLQPMGFVMRDRIKQMDFAHMSLAFRVLGRFHALSFALRDQRPEVFATKITTLKETLFTDNVIGDEFFATRFEKLGKLITTALAEEDPRYTERFSEFAKTAFNRMAWFCDGSVAEPYSVLGHGDFWMNNMLFRYEKDSVEPQEMYMLDFQSSRYASPAIDISYTLYCSCSQELREKHSDELIKIYHESLSTFLLELGSDPKKLFPYEALLAQLKKFSIISAVIAVFVLPFFTSQGKDVQNISGDNSDLLGLQQRIHRDQFFKNTLRDAFKDLINRNYI